MDPVTAYLSIGDFSRASHMSIKMLRYYHEIGLLTPADVDPRTGYRRYRPEQLPTAQVIRRFRELDMPLEEIERVLTAPDLHTRNRQIAAHLRRLEAELGRTQQAVASLRDILTMTSAETDAPIELRDVPAASAAAITAVVEAEDSVAWLHGALGELRATVAAQHLQVGGPAGGMFDEDLFTQHRGRATVFLPCADTVRAVGRVTAADVPAVELAVITHLGPPHDVDRSYAALATYVARHALAVDGAIREYYLIGPAETDQASEWKTEIGWPIFRTAGTGQ